MGMAIDHWLFLCFCGDYTIPWCKCEVLKLCDYLEGFVCVSLMTLGSIGMELASSTLILHQLENHSDINHTISVWYSYLHLVWLILMVIVDKYTNPMDAMGYYGGYPIIPIIKAHSQMVVKKNPSPKKSNSQKQHLCKCMLIALIYV